MPLLSLISGAPLGDVAASYSNDAEDFTHGHLEISQRASARDYQRFLYSSPAWARKFQLLEANAMAWRFLNDNVLILLADDRIPWDESEDNIEKRALQATALTYLHRFPEADQILAEADNLCAANDTEVCGATRRAHGILLLERGQARLAEQAFSQTLEFAHKKQLGMLEATALLNLGHAVSQQDQHDRAIQYYRLAARKAAELRAVAVQEAAIGNEGWEEYTLGNFQKALELFSEAKNEAASIGDTGVEIVWVTASAKIYADTGQSDLAEQSDLQAITLSRRINKKQGVIDASEDVAQVYINEGRPDDAGHYADEALTLTQKTESLPDVRLCHLLQGEVAAIRHDWLHADPLLHDVILSQGSQNRMRWEAQHTLAAMYEAQGQVSAAEQAYRVAIALVEGARADLKQELSQLSFLSNAAHIYDDYIHFLIAQGRSDEALDAADWSRARTLQQGLGLISSRALLKPPPFHASAIASATNATLLFYWMGEKESYLWAVSPEKTTLVKLPPKSAIVPVIERYRRTLLALKDPLRANGGRDGVQGDKDGRDLYEMLIAPVAGVVSSNRPVVLFTDGAMTQLNFETLLAGGATPHFWIDDATISSAPSIHLFAAKAKSASSASDRLLLFGDAISADPALPHLPMAALEMQRVKANFHPSDEAVFAGAQATPLTYIASEPEQFSYIHFVAHGTASNTDPLESAVILSKDNAGEDSYKLYAREILQHPISARLVTISACNSSGSASFAGEGVVGLSWAFLRAGAHNTIGTLWDVSDASTPELMDRLYSGLQHKEPPATALRNAKLSLLHSSGNFNRPFYWAPFQLYSGH